MQMYDEENESGGAVQILDRSEMTLEFSAENTRTSVKMGTDMEMSTILNKDENKGLILMSGMLGEIAITTTYAELTKSSKEIEPEIEFLEQTKEILGYECKKAKLRYANGAIATYWYTEEIQFSKNGIENMHVSLPGVPLEYKIDSEGSIMTFTANRIEKTTEAEDSLPFSTLPPEGYKVLTFAEFEENGF